MEASCGSSELKRKDHSWIRFPGAPQNLKFKSTKKENGKVFLSNSPLILLLQGKKLKSRKRTSFKKDLKKLPPRFVLLKARKEKWQFWQSCEKKFATFILATLSWLHCSLRKFEFIQKPLLILLFQRWIFCFMVVKRLCRQKVNLKAKLKS